MNWKKTSKSTQKKWDAAEDGVYLVWHDEFYPIVAMPDYDNDSMYDANGEPVVLFDYSYVQYVKPGKEQP